MVMASNSFFGSLRDRKYDLDHADLMF